MSSYDLLWVFKYAPKKLDDLILSPENRDFFSKIDDNTPHLLLYGNSGTGKTTLAKILVNDILKCQYLYINASDENGVETIRNKVISFSQTRSFDGKKKVIILDEFCGTTPEAQRILRNVMEEYVATTRFILTANYINRIIEPIKSRCLLFDILPDQNNVLKRCEDILSAENVQVSEEQKNLLKNHIDFYFPDIRRIINDLQRYSVNGKLNIIVKNVYNNIAKEVFSKLQAKKHIDEIRKFILEEEKNFGGDYQIILKNLFDQIYESDLPEIKKKSAMLEIGESMYRDNIVMDHEINFFCCIINLWNVLFKV